MISTYAVSKLAIYLNGHLPVAIALLMLLALLFHLLCFFESPDPPGTPALAAELLTVL